MRSQKHHKNVRPNAHHVGGFTLLEVMIALTLGLLLGIGIVSLFGSTSRTNKLQDGLARLQENGRYAVGRVQADLRMSGAQFCSNHSGNSSSSASAPLWPARAPFVFAENLGLYDVGAANVAIDPADGKLTATAQGAAYGLSPRYFIQGYHCVSGSCTPSVHSGANQIPAAALAAGSRVPNSDVLTIRYQRGTGWPMISDGGCASGGTITVSPQPGDDPLNIIGAGSVLVSDCQNPSIIPVTGASANVIALGTLLAGTPNCSANALRDVRVFNFSDDFVTVSYYLAFREDQNPDAQPNSAAAKRLIPTLIRRENGVDAELVQGVDRLDFRYGVQEAGGNTRYLTAAQVEDNLGGTIVCPPKPEGVALLEPGCLWRAVRAIEAHMLVNSVDEVIGLDATSQAYRYTYDDAGGSAGGTVDQTTLPSGLNLADMLRREFIAYSANRNYNP